MSLWYFPWFGILLYVVLLAVMAGALYLIIRMAVFHALRAHTRWVESRMRD